MLADIIMNCLVTNLIKKYLFMKSNNLKNTFKTRSSKNLKNVKKKNINKK